MSEQVVPIFDGFHCQHGYPAGEYCPACGELPCDSELHRSFGIDDFESEFDDEGADPGGR